MFVEQRLAYTVAFGKNNGERYLAGTECIDKININFLGGQVGINEDKSHRELLTFDQVVVDHGGEIVLLLFGNAGKAVARQINQMPVTIDKEEIEQAGFPRGGGYLGESVSAGEHINQ